MKDLNLNKRNIPPVTINRLCLYHRCLEKITEQKDSLLSPYISSSEISHLTGINPAQIRKDLAYFGQFGLRGIGYPVQKLQLELERILGLDKVWSVIIVGAGNLGSALLGYEGFKRRGFLIKAIFDRDQTKIGRRIHGLRVNSINQMEEFIKKEHIDIGILVVPAESAQEVANIMVKSGIKAIINFAPLRLSLPSKIKVNNVDLSIEFEGLTYHLKMC
ncbi:MAG: redox-sensing transcriptional repressor Rex [Candidatus Caldatribacteriota bacterium]